jgi:hypothetical protein
MIVLASVIAVGSALNTWVDRQLLDTEYWVGASDALLADDEVRAALSVFLVDQLYDNIDVEGELASRLPDELSGLAAPLSIALRGQATQSVDRLLDTRRARSSWAGANRVAHETLVRVLKDETRDGVSTADGVVTLQLATLVHDLGAQLGLPTLVLDRIPPEAGTIVVADSGQLRRAQQAVRLVETMSVVLFFLVVGLYAGAVVLASDRRRALRNVGWSLAASGLALLLARWFALSLLGGDVETAPTARSAVHAAAIIATGIVAQLAWAGVAIGCLIACYAVLTGPSAAANACRRILAPAVSHRLPAWIAGGALVLLIGFIIPGTTVRNWWVGLTLLVFMISGIERLRSQVRHEHPDVTFAVVWREIELAVDGPRRDEPSHGAISHDGLSGRGYRTTTAGAETPPSSTEMRMPSGSVPQ